MTDPSDNVASRLLGELENSPAGRLARELAESPTAKLAREMANSPSAKLARELADSPAARMAREFDLAQRVDVANLSAARGLMAEFKPMMLDPGISKTLADIAPLRIDPALTTALAQIRQMEIAPGLGQAIAETQSAFARICPPGGALAEAARAFEEHNLALHASLATALGGPLGEIARMNQWATAIGGIGHSDIGKLYPSLPNVAAEVVHLHGSIAGSLVGSVTVDQQSVSAMLGLNLGVGVGLDTTRFKMSAFAGITDVLGSGTPAWNEAYRSIFGEWRSHPGLPENFWRDGRVRRRMYEAAEVDPGLAGLTSRLAVEVVVESGLLSGARSEANAVAAVRLGEVSMTIRSHGTRGDAYKVLESFEVELRNYISRKLSESAGPEWFKQRVNGTIQGEAKGIRKQALERGETAMPLIHYTELGHLGSIILTTTNWDEVFGDVFINRPAFEFDMQKLIAARRPTMHVRPIDGVRLVELICVVQRLSRQMADDGAWKIAAVSER